MNSLARPHLFSPLKLGALDLQHRIFLSCRPESLPSEVDGPTVSPLAIYYGARATTGGLVICTVTPEHVASEVRLIQPGLQTAVQVNCWRRVTDAIHARGGLAVARIGDVPWVAASWPDADEVDEVLMSYRTAAENAGDAGFDGIELVGVKGSLPERLLSAGMTGTTGAFAHAPAYKDFFCDAIETLCVVWPRDRIGVSISLPESTADLDATSRLLGSLGSTEIAYTHLSPPNVRQELGLDAIPPEFRSHFPGGILVSGEWSVRDADAAIRRADVDAVGPHWAFASDANLPHNWRAAIDADQR